MGTNPIADWSVYKPLSFVFGHSMVQGVDNKSVIYGTFFSNFPKKNSEMNPEFGYKDIKEIEEILLEEKSLSEVQSNDYKKSSKTLWIKPEDIHKDSIAVSKAKIGKWIAYNYSDAVVLNNTEVDELVVKTEKLILNNSTVKVLKTRGYTEIAGDGNIGLLVNLDGAPVKIKDKLKVEKVGITSNARITADFTENKALFQTYSVQGYQTNIPTSWIKEKKMKTGFSMQNLMAVRGLSEHQLMGGYDLEDGVLFNNKPVEYSGDYEKLPITMKTTLSKVAEKPVLLTFIPEFSDGTVGLPVTLVPPLYFTYRDTMSPYAPVKVWYVQEALVPQAYNKGILEDLNMTEYRQRGTGGIFTYFEYTPDGENVVPQFRLSDYQKRLGLFTKPIQIKEKKQ